MIRPQNCRYKKIDSTYDYEDGLVACKIIDLDEATVAAADNTTIEIMKVYGGDRIIEAAVIISTGDTTTTTLDVGLNAAHLKGCRNSDRCNYIRSIEPCCGTRRHDYIITRGRNRRYARGALGEVLART
jgi:hypothetical protein